jgi:hypothetical protein
MIKRYLLFAGHNYESYGGWENFIDYYDDLKEAITAGKNLGRYDWWHVVDITTAAIVIQED